MAINVEKKTAVVEVISDAICPWCFVGKRRLEKALANLGEAVDARTVWRPFELNPNTPREGVDREAYLRSKYGLVRIQQMQENLKRAAEDDGITFRFDLARRVPNTFDSHRLVWYAGKHGRQNEIVEAIFAAYFVEGQDIGQTEVLVRIAEAAGLPADEVRSMLSSDQGLSDVRSEEEQARRLGVNGVPTFIVNGRMVGSGAHPPEVLASAILQAARPMAGESCSLDNPC